MVLIINALITILVLGLSILLLTYLIYSFTCIMLTFFVPFVLAVQVVLA